MAALNESGKIAVSAGNADVPLVEAIDDQLAEIFVVEASSFRLAQSQRFAPQVGCWINFAPDHLDVHRDLASYEAAKARIWADLPDGAAAVANASDPVVMRHVPERHSNITFSTTSDADWHLDGSSLTGPSGKIIEVDDLWRSLPHDVEDALAASAVATFMGATPDGLRTALTEFQLAAHRVQFVGEIDGALFYNDSKATTPHATVAALHSFSQAVLIAGGRNKGIDLSPLRDAADHVRAVVAIGEAASDIVDVFAGLRPVEIAADMDDAVKRAAAAAGSGMAVILSPACASFDWYVNYGARGDDFARAVADLANRVSGEPDDSSRCGYSNPAG